jgi:hypothetical protein
LSQSNFVWPDQNSRASFLIIFLELKGFFFTYLFKLGFESAFDFGFESVFDQKLHILIDPDQQQRKNVQNNHTFVAATLIAPTVYEHKVKIST